MEDEVNAGEEEVVRVDQVVANPQATLNTEKKGPTELKEVHSTLWGQFLPPPSPLPPIV